MRHNLIRPPGLLAILAILILAGPTAALAGRSGDDPMAQILALPEDTNSTFRLGTAFGAVDGDTVTVPLYLDTDSLVTFYANTISWTDGALTYIDVVEGPGAPDTAGSIGGIDATAGMLSFSYSTSGGPLSIGANEAVAYVSFEVGCLGSSGTANISFFEDGVGNQNNFFSTPNGSYAPSLQTGFVRYMFVYMYYVGDHVDAYPGATSIPYVIDFQTTVPATPLQIELNYDSTKLEAIGVVGLPGLGGATVFSNFGTGTVNLTFVGGVPLSASTQDIVEVEFRTLTNTDDYVVDIDFGAVTTVVSTCGETAPLGKADGTISVPNHTADVQWVDVSPYNTSSSFNVPFVFDSNVEVHDYKLFVDFPDDLISVVGAVQEGTDIVPFVTANGGTMSITSGLTDPPGQVLYDPDGLPRVVFRVQFTPTAVHPHGTTANLTFLQSSSDEVRYIIAPGTPPDYSYAAIGYDDGVITFRDPPPSGGGPSCPTLYSWDGSGYRLENTLLAACDGAVMENDITDFYLINHPPRPDDQGKLRFSVREDDIAVSTLRGFELLAVDHAVSEPIQVTEDGQILSLNQPLALQWARDHTGRDITELVENEDQVFYDSAKAGYIDVSFGAVGTTTIGADLVADIKKPPKEDHHKMDPGISSKLRISVMDKRGNWQFLEDADPRWAHSLQSTVIDPSFIEAGQELVLRYEWDGIYRTDSIEMTWSKPYEGELARPALSAARHSIDGSVLDRFGAGAVMLSPGQSLELVFDVSSLGKPEKGQARDYILITKGHYEPGEAVIQSTPARGFALDANSPNPFNPSTVIRYSLPAETHVELSIHDVRGALVRTLISGVQTAGEQRALWDGRDDTGRPVASGAYFYKLSTPEQTASRKMLLLK